MKYIYPVVIFIFFFAVSVNASIKVVKVKGSAAYKSGRSWSPVKKGQSLRTGVKISTGSRSYVVVKLHSHTVTIKQLSLIKVYRNKVKDIRVGLKRGGVRARVNRRTKVRTRFRVSTPVATSSVRGTIEDIFYGPRSGMIIRAITGSIEGENLNGSRWIISGNQVYIQKKDSNAPVFILKNVKDSALTNLFNDYMTQNEKEGFFFNMDEFGSETDTIQNIADFFGTEGGTNQSTPGSATIQVTWPDKK